MTSNSIYRKGFLHDPQWISGDTVNSSAVQTQVFWLCQYLRFTWMVQTSCIFQPWKYLFVFADNHTDTDRVSCRFCNSGFPRFVTRNCIRSIKVNQGTLIKYHVIRHACSSHVRNSVGKSLSQKYSFVLYLNNPNCITYIMGSNWVVSITAAVALPKISASDKWMTLLIYL